MRTPVWIVAALALAACHAKVSGDLKLDGQPFAVAECRSGEALGFSGLEIADASGRRIRMVLRADGGTNVAIFPPGAAKGDTLGDCGTLQLHTQNSRINSIHNVEGQAALSCGALGHTLSGSLSFENCH